MPETNRHIAHMAFIEKHGDPTLGPYGVAFQMSLHGGTIVAEAHAARWPAPDDPRIAAIADAMADGRLTLDLLDGRLLARGWYSGMGDVDTPANLLLAGIAEVVRRLVAAAEATHG